MKGGGGCKIPYDYAAQVKRASRGSVQARGRQQRILFIALLAVTWSSILVFRLASLQLFAADFWQSWGVKQHFSEVKIASERGPVYDRNGQLLAVSVPAGSIYVRPKQVKDKEYTTLALTETLDIDPVQIRKALNSKQPFVWIKRQIPRVHAQRVEDLKLPGVGQILEARRFYPYNQAGSTLIGRVGIDGNGLSGLEARYDHLLSGELLKTKVTRDALGNIIHDLNSVDDHFELPKGSGLHLTIDAAMQYILDEELEIGREAAGAAGALGALVNAETGEILALGQAPSFNFNEDKVSSHSALINKTVETVFEPGSIMKPIVTAAALDSGVVKATDIIDCERGAYRFGGHTIKDTHKVGAVSVHDVVVHSSNIGMTKIGTKLGKDRLYDSLEKFGFGQAIGLNLPGETKGILRKKSDWSTVDIATHSFGQGVAVTPLQMLRALSAIVNGGVMPELSIIAGQNGYERGRRVVSESAAADVREMLFSVVEDQHGTGKRAAIDGVRIGGKTGTAQKARKDGRGYAQGLYMASFMGFADASQINLKEKLALIVVIDEPHKVSIYGGTLAAPVFKNTMTRVLHLLATRHQLKGSAKEFNRPQPSQDLQLSDGLVNAAYKF